MGRIEDRLAALGISLPGPHPPHAPLLPLVVHGGRAQTSGQLPRLDGRLTSSGLLGRDLDVTAGRAAARVCGLNALSTLRAGLGDLDRVERVLSVLVFVACVPGFTEQPAVADGASEVLMQAFGDPAGRHTRSAVGVAALPRAGPVEIEVTVALLD